ncbi:MAG: RloB family protein [Hylemonella sp.]
MRENQPKHRQIARERARIERREAWRREAGSALLVCEGACTEPHYLKGLRAYLGINPANVEIVEGGTKSNAVAVVRRAMDRFAHAPRDRVFVVVDAEQGDLDRALELCRTPLQRRNRRKGLPEIRIEPIVSIPCFEFWLLLHFRYCDQPFANFAGLLPKLRASLPNYSKGDARIFDKVGGGEGLLRALDNAAKLRQALAATGAKRPATDMDKLVEALREIVPPA